MLVSEHGIRASHPFIITSAIAFLPFLLVKYSQASVKYTLFTPSMESDEHGERVCQTIFFVTKFFLRNFIKLVSQKRNNLA